jgi:hypothetical protein
MAIPNHNSTTKAINNSNYSQAIFAIAVTSDPMAVTTPLSS